MLPPHRINSHIGLISCLPGNILQTVHDIYIMTCSFHILRSSLFVLLTASLLLLGNCCPEDQNQNYLNLIMTTEPKSLDPALSTDITTAILTGLMYNNLVEFGVGTEIVPGLARSWTISADGKTYTFTLRDSVRFWNGDTLSSKDVQYSFERLLSPLTRSPQTWLLMPIVGAREFSRGLTDRIAGIQVLSPAQIQLSLETPFAPFLGFLGSPATAIVPANWDADLKQRPMGTGPWIFEFWEADRAIKLNRNPDYFKGPALQDGIILNSINEILTMAIEFEAGNLDIMAVPNSEFKYWTHSPVWKPYIYTLEELGVYYLAMNVERPPFHDLRVRQALDLAIDKEKIIKQILHNSARVANGAIPPRIPGFDSTLTLERYDPGQAKDLLRAAGYEAGCEFDLWVDPAAAVSQTIEAFQHYLNEAGFKVNIIRNDWNMMRDAMRQGKTDAYWGNWWADYADPENFLAPLFQTETAARRNRYSNPEVDRLIHVLQQSLDEDIRIETAMQIDSILMAEVPYSFMWYPTSYTVVQPNLKGYVPHLMPNANKYLTTYFEQQD